MSIETVYIDCRNFVIGLNYDEIERGDHSILVEFTKTYVDINDTLINVNIDMHVYNDHIQVNINRLPIENITSFEQFVSIYKRFIQLLI